MGWNRVKMVLAAVLAAANVLLLAINVKQSRENEYVPDEAIEEITEILERNGIFCAENVLLMKKQTSAIFGGKSESMYFTEIATAISDSTVHLSFTTPSGAVLTMANGDRYTFENGFGVQYETLDASSLLDDEFFGTLHKADGDELLPLSSAEEESLHATVRAFLAGASGTAAQTEMSYTIRFCGSAQGSEILYCVCVQTVKNMEIVGLVSTFAVLDGKVIGMCGKWCFADMDETYSAQLYDQINILYKAKDRISQERASVYTVLTSLDLVYTAYYQAEAMQFYLIPAWKIVTDEGREYVLNATDGSFCTN